MVQNTKNR